MDTTELGISTNGMERVLQSIEGTDQEKSDSYREAKWLLAILKQYVPISAKYRNVYVSPRQSQEAIRKSETGVRGPVKLVTKDLANDFLELGYIFIPIKFFIYCD